MFGSVNFPLSGSVVFRFSDLPYLILHHLDGLRSRGHRQLLGHVSTKRYVETPHLCCLMMFYMCICWCLHSYVTRCTVIFNYIYNRLIYYVYQSESPIHIDSTHSCAIKFNTPTFVAWLPDILKIHHDLTAPGKCKVPIAGWLKIGMPKNGICVSQKKTDPCPNGLVQKKRHPPRWQCSSKIRWSIQKRISEKMCFSPCLTQTQIGVCLEMGYTSKSFQI